MTPSHSNKRGVRYRYYVSHALMQKRKSEAGSISRIPAPDIETAVVRALREHLKNCGKPDCSTTVDDRELIECHVKRVIIKPEAIEVQLIVSIDAPEQTDNQEISVTDQRNNNPQSIAITIPWAAPSFIAAKGILHAPSSQSSMKPETRDALLTAIAKARSWIDDLLEGRAASFTDIAKLEGKVERHVRFLAPLAFVSPRITAAIVDASAPHDLTVTALVKALPYSWAEQERRIGLANG
jgi:hypothetical protein